MDTSLSSYISSVLQRIDLKLNCCANLYCTDLTYGVIRYFESGEITATEVGLRPDRANIKFIVKPCLGIRKLCCQLTDELMAKRTATPKTILFCR